jgi:cation diffusion facilitator family transporter
MGSDMFHGQPTLDHDDDHEHHHDEAGEHDHVHEHRPGVLGLFDSIFHAHRHDIDVDDLLEADAEGMRTLWISLVCLTLTASLQSVIVLMSGSVGLLADTVHNFSDALTAVPLWLAFVVGRRPANHRYTYGYGRAEDVAGLAIVVVIVASAGLALWEAYQKLLHPTVMHQVGWVMAAAVAGFLGNEAVALMRIRTGRRVGSAALVADGDHARIDGLTSLGVLVGAVAVALGVPLADPLVGLLISVAILWISKDAAVTIWHRLMDAVDPMLVERAQSVATATPGVVGVHDLRLRWLGHRLHADLHVTVDEELPIVQAHAIAEDVRHRLFHALPRLGDASVHLDPCGHSGTDHHATTAHHRAR